MKTMPEVPMGSLCWAEYHAKDVEKSKVFYTNVLNWKIREIRSGEAAYYFFQSKGQDVCGMFGVGSDWKNAPYWNPYVAVDDVDETVKKAQALGGKVRIPPMDIPDGGRMACLEDPNGAVFSVFSPQK